jgi:hypothetical protein
MTAKLTISNNLYAALIQTYNIYIYIYIPIIHECLYTDTHTHIYDLHMDTHTHIHDVPVRSTQYVSQLKED